MKDKHLKELLETFRSVAKDDATLFMFVQDLFTPAELEEFVRRWQIVKLLSTGKTQREVAEKLHVSIATVSRGARMLRNPKGGFNQILKKKSKL